MNWETLLTWDNLLLWLRPLFWIVLGVVLASTLSRAIDRFASEQLTRHQLVLLRRLAFYSVVALFTMNAVRETGFDIGVLLGAAGILTVALGFASQTSASNIISGLFLLTEKPFELGNFIEVGGVRGEVVSIDLLSVKLRTLDNLYLRIPNETLIKSTLTNFSRFPIRRVDLPVAVAYGEDLSRVRGVLTEEVRRNACCMEEPAPFVLMQQFGSSSIDLQLSFWVRREDVRELRSELLFAIKAAFDREDIEIPFPHMSLYAGKHSGPVPVTLNSSNTSDQDGE